MAAFARPPGAGLVNRSRIRSLRLSVGIGLVAGFGGGLVSLGGGTLIIPLLMGFAELDPLQARGTALAVAVITATVGSAVYAHGGAVDWNVALWVAVPSMIIAPIAAYASERLPRDELRAVFGLVVAAGGVLLILRDLWGVHGFVHGWEHSYLLLVGVLEGLVAGVVGVSGGPVLAPLFVFGLGMPQQLAQGCSLAARIPATLTSVWENWRLGNIVTPLLLGLVPGAIVGAVLGGRLALVMPAHALRTVFGGFLIVLGLHYLRSIARLLPGRRR